MNGEYFLSRSELLLGSVSINKLNSSKVVVLGLGGVGSFVTEGLARSGIGNLILVDDDTVALSNLNRQIIALQSTLGEYKVDVMKKRVLDINPDCNITTFNEYINKESIPLLIPHDADYVVDAIDTITSKLDVIEYCKNNDIKVISSMGTGNKFDPTQFKVSDISKTKVCPLAKVIRHELKNRRIKHVKVVYSEEVASKPDKGPSNNSTLNSDLNKTDSQARSKRQTPGSLSFVPPVAGFILASEVIKDLLL